MLELAQVLVNKYPNLIKFYYKEKEITLEDYRTNSSPAVAQAMFRLHNEIFPKQFENPDSVSCYGCRQRVQNKLINYYNNIYSKYFNKLSFLTKPKAE